MVTERLTEDPWVLPVIADRDKFDLNASVKATTRMRLILVASALCGLICWVALGPTRG